MVLTKNGIELWAYSQVPKEHIGELYLKWLNDIEIVTSIGSYTLLLPKDISFIDESYSRFTAPNAIGFFIKDSITNRWIGTAKIDKIDLYNSSAEIGIMIGEKEYWGKGIATIVYDLLLSYAFKDLGLFRIWGGCLESNKAMAKVFQKKGFKQDALLRKNIKIKGKMENSFLFSILKNEYENECI